MSDSTRLAKALQDFPGVRSVVAEGDTVRFFVDDGNIAGVIRNLRHRIDASPVAGRIFFRVTFDEEDTVGFVVEAPHRADIDVFTRALTGESRRRFRLASGCPKCGDKGMQYIRKKREYICKVCGSTIDEDLVEK
jgi:ribosomal protein S27E